MSKLLELSDEIDNDAISMVMQECVENFSEQLQPFGVDLMSKLVEQFMRIAQEVYSTQNTYADGNGDDVDYDDDNDSSEKVMAAIGLLNTMITVLLSFENSQAILFKLEEVYYPIMEFVFANKIDDFFTEVGELIENSTFLLRLISPTMWKAFALIVSSFEDGIALLYIEELMPALNNYLIFGKLSELGGTGSQEVSQGIYTIFNSILDGDETQIEFNDISFACQLGQNLILSLEQQSIPYIPMVMKKVLPVFKNMIEDKHHVRNNSFDVNVNNVLVSSIVYDLVSSLQVLGEIGLAQIFFERWLKLIPVLKRVFDIKLSVLGLISILNNNEVLGQFDEGFIKQLISALVFLLKILPDAIKSLEERRQNFNELDDAGMQRLWEQEQEAFNNFKGDFNDDEEDFEGEGEEEEGGANDEEYDSFLRQQEENFKLKSSGFYDEEDEQIHEDPLSSTPLDNLNVFKYFKDFLVNLQANELHKYQLLFGTLGDSDQQVVKDIIEIVKE